MMNLFDWIVSGVMHRKLFNNKSFWYAIIIKLL